MEAVGKLDFPERTLEAYTDGFLKALAPRGDLGCKFARRHRLRVRKRFADPAAHPEQPQRRDDRAQRVFRQHEGADVRGQSRTASRTARQRDDVAAAPISASCSISTAKRSSSSTIAAASIEGPQLLALRHDAGRAAASPARASRCRSWRRQRWKASPAAYGATIVRTRSDRRSLMALAEREAAHRSRLPAARTTN